ncbi:MAG: hypothetical protein ABSE05_09635 [Syntrophales bacterium]
MKRFKTNTFILELPLVVTPGDERQLLARFEAARRLYNAVLGEALRRQSLMRESKEWQKSRILKDRKERSATFREISAAYGFTSASVSSFGTNCKNEAGWQDRLGAHEAQRIAERAFTAVESYGIGLRGRPRFKGLSRPPHSIESKTNDTGIRWKAGTGCIEWHGLCLRAKLDPSGKDEYLLDALRHDTKFCRILWRVEKGNRRWYAQLAQEGLPPLKHQTGLGKVGMDVGPSTVAICCGQTAELVSFCPTIKQPWKEARKLQRALDRSRRDTNPECFNTDGTWKKGKRQTVFSNRYKKTRNELAETERRLASERKRSHGELANAIISHGTTVQS